MHKCKTLGDRENFARLGPKSYLVTRRIATAVPLRVTIRFRIPCPSE